MLRPKKKISKKEIKHDPLLEILYRIQNIYEENQNRIWAAVGIIVAVILIIWVVVNWKISSENEASTMLGKALVSYQQQDYEEAARQLEPILTEYPKTEVGVEARYYLGLVAQEQGNGTLAREYLNEFLDKSNNADLICGALSKIAFTYELEDDFALAADYYERASKNCQNAFQKQSYKIFSMLNLIKIGEYEKVRLILNDIDDDDLASLRLEEAVDEIRGELKLLSDS